MANDIPIKSGKIICASCKRETIVGSMGILFCPDDSCKNSEAKYYGIPLVELSNTTPSHIADFGKTQWECSCPIGKNHIF